MKVFYGLIAISLVVSLTACSEEKSDVQDASPTAEQGDTTDKMAPAAPEPAKPMDDAVAPAAAPQAEPADEAQEPAAPEPQADATEKPSGSKTESACLKAVGDQTGESDLAVLSSEFSEANSLVMVGVGPQRAPWRCLVSNDGVVAEITSMADEGAQ